MGTKRTTGLYADRITTKNPITLSLYHLIICLLLINLSSYQPVNLLYGAEVLQEIIVRDGDTLWSISNYYLKDARRWPDILKHNPRLSSDPNVVLPGMRLKVPILLIKEHLRAAHLVHILRDVRYRRRKESAWRRASLDMRLYEEDGVRTMEESQANVRFPSGETLRLFENSMLIVRPEKPRDEAELLAGQVRASRAKIITAETTVTPLIAPLSVAPDFRTRIKEDKTTLVKVHRGAVDVSARGKSVTVREGFGTEIKFGKAPEIPTKLPEAPSIEIVPTDTKVLSSKDGKFEFDIPAPETDKKTFAQEPEKPGEKPNGRARILDRTITKYRLQIATSPAFIRILHDKVQELKGRVTLETKALELDDGIYFWRISYLDELGFEGKFSQTRSFLIDTQMPALTLLAPRDGAEYDGEFIHVEGNTEPGTTLTVNETAVQVDDSGYFLHAMLVKGRLGAVPVKVTATDAAGNSTSIERTAVKVRRGAVRKITRTQIAEAPQAAEQILGITEERPAIAEERRGITWVVAAITASVILGVILIFVGM